MGSLARFALALAGLGLVRRALYGARWGHGGSARTALAAAVGAGLALPLWVQSPGARPWLLGLGAVVLLPWAPLSVAFLHRRMREGLAALALDWESELHEDPARGLVTVERPPAADRRAAWAGNVLVHVRSLHPGVPTRRTLRMMGFVVGLEREPSLLCSLARGWGEPRYHRSEWRTNTTMQGTTFAMSLGDVLAEGGRETGGEIERLDREPARRDPRLVSFDLVACDDEEAFARVFAGPLLDALAVSAQGPLWECNVTPTSVNVFTVYGGPRHQRAHVAFLDVLASAVVR